MGMDIHGLRPTGTKIETDDYMTRIYHEMENGIYFRAAAGSWTPILTCCKIADEGQQLGIDFTGWGHNDGYGLYSQELCTKLADALDKIVEVLLEDTECVKDDRFGINSGYWSKEDGGIIDTETKNALNAIAGDNIFITPEIEYNGIKYKPSTSTTIEHLQYFIKFLRNCGGFEIW